MEAVSSSSASVGVAVEVQAEEGGELRKGPWTADEDLLLVKYIAVHGDGRWNSLARSAGLKRSGKSCRLRWLNYLRPNVRRGNFTPEEQLLILELHSRWGNRWSRIAQHLPGRTDNEIKNYWRTRVQKLAKQLKCDVNSHQFRDAVRYLWMPRLMERIQANSAISAAHSAAAYSTAASVTVSSATVANTFVVPADMTTEPVHDMASSDADVNHIRDYWSSGAGSLSDSSSGACSSSSPASSDRTDCYVAQGSRSSDYADEFPTVDQILSSAGGCSEFPLSPCGYLQQGIPDFEQSGWAAENLWAADDIWSLTAAL